MSWKKTLDDADKREDYEKSFDEKVLSEQRRFRKLPQSIQESAHEYWSLCKIKPEEMSDDQIASFMELSDLVIEHDITPICVPEDLFPQSTLQD